MVLVIVVIGVLALAAIVLALAVHRKLGQEDLQRQQWHARQHGADSFKNIRRK